jgi:GxxExxY protein
METNYKHSELTGRIIKIFYKVYNTLGYGFLGKVYENALMIELRKSRLQCFQQYPIDVFYDDEKVGLYYAELL